MVSVAPGLPVAPVIEARGVVKRYGSTTALDGAMRGYGLSVFENGVASLSTETDAFIFSQLTEVIQAELV